VLQEGRGGASFCGPTVRNTPCEKTIGLMKGNDRENRGVAGVIVTKERTNLPNDDVPCHHSSYQ